MKIIVEYNGSQYYWVDTITMHDEQDYPCAILVSRDGTICIICTSAIKVIDDNYNYEKSVRKQIDTLKQETYQLQQQMLSDATLQQQIGLDAKLRLQYINEAMK